MKSLLKFLFYIVINIPIIVYLYDLHHFTGKFRTSRSPNATQIHLYRDEYDIPHIHGSTLKDCFYGVGIAHAQDRLFSLTVKKIIFSGRLCEFFGPQFVELDKYFRNLLITHSSKENAANFDEEIKELFGSYIQGLNDYSSNLWLLPIEFYLTGLPLEPFSLEDGVILWKFLSYALTYDWQHEILREKLAEVFSEEEAQEMTAAFSKFQFDDTVILNDEELKQSGIYEEYIHQNSSAKQKHAHNFSHHHTHKYIENVFYEIRDTLDNMEIGSNNWVIHGNHTKTGMPLLANDPHLDNHIPTLWYLAELVYDEGEKYVVGATLPGLPFVFLGRTQFFSWGVTALHTDTSDFYKETLNEDATKYLYEGEYHDLEVITEEIKIKGQQSEYFLVKKTRHGPLLEIVQDVYNVDYEFPNMNLSFAWMSYEKNDTTYRTLVNLYRLTKNTEDIAKTFADFVSPFINIVYATNNGDIGYYACGWLPIRENPSEAFFLNGDIKENDWIGHINNSMAPQIINPKKGYIVTANNKLSTDNIIFHKSLHMLPSARAFRIDQMIREYIEKGEKIGVEEIKKMQLDVKDCYAEKIVPLMLDLVEKYSKELGFTSQSNETILLNFIKNLRSWDFQMKKNSNSAAIYSVWEYLFLAKLLGKIIDLEDRERIVYSLNFEQFIFRKIMQWHEGSSQLNEEWCEGYSSPPVHLKNYTCIYHLISSLLDTHEYLTIKQGTSDVKNWRWGTIHKMKYKHIPFSESFWPLKAMYERQYPADGNRRTVNVAIPNFRSSKLDAVHSANLRMIVDMSENSKSYYIIDTGLNENVFSGRYAEWLEKHRDGEYLEMKFGKEKAQEYQKVLILE